MIDETSHKSQPVNGLFPMLQIAFTRHYQEWPFNIFNCLDAVKEGHQRDSLSKSSFVCQDEVLMVPKCLH